MGRKMASKMASKKGWIWVAGVDKAGSPGCGVGSWLVYFSAGLREEGRIVDWGLFAAEDAGG